MQLVDVIADSERLLWRLLLAVRALHGETDREELLNHLIVQVNAEWGVDSADGGNRMLTVHSDFPGCCFRCPRGAALVGYFRCPCGAALVM